MAAEVATPPAAPSTYNQSPYTGRFAHLYQPPAHKSPNPRHASDQPVQADYFTSGSRKRSRADSSLANGLAKHHTSQQRTPIRDDDSSLLFSTDSLLANDQYTLKGGFDTPGLLANTDSDTLHSLDRDARRKMSELHLNTQSTETAFAGPLARERNGLPRQPITFSSEQHGYHHSSPSWTRLALTLPFSIAGKMFSFGGAVLKGFYAGGGQGYQIDRNGHSASFAPFHSRSDLAPGTPIPGAWRDSPPASFVDHNDAFEGDFEQDNPLSPRPPPNKRRLTDKDTWVIVGTPDLEKTTPTSPRRSLATPRLSRPSASRTASRRSMLNSSSRRHSYIASTGSPAFNASLSPQHHVSRPRYESHSRQHSFGGRQSSPLHTITTADANGTPMSPETEKLRRRQAKQDRATDRTMTNMSRQLEELIRQGQEALGTRFMVEDNGDNDDEGAYVDEEDED